VAAEAVAVSLLLGRIRASRGMEIENTDP